jgi:hypothetical protein
MAARISCVVLERIVSAVWFIDSALKYRRSAAAAMFQTWAEWAPGLAPIVTPGARSSSVIHRAADADAPSLVPRGRKIGPPLPFVHPIQLGLR